MHGKLFYFVRPTQIPLLCSFATKVDFSFSFFMVYYSIYYCMACGLSHIMLCVLRSRMELLFQ